MSSDLPAGPPPAAPSDAGGAPGAPDAAEATRVLPTNAAAEPAPRDVAWDDPQTRSRAAARLLPTLVAGGVGLVALVATIVLAVIGVIQRPWGLWALVGLSGLAGGCLAGALAGWSIEAPLRRLLKRHPWEDLSGEVGQNRQLVVVVDQRRRAYDLGLDRREDVGVPGTPLTVRSAGPVDEKVVEHGPDARWRLAERVAVAQASEEPDEDDDDDEWVPSGPVGEQPDADGLYRG